MTFKFCFFPLEGEQEVNDTKEIEKEGLGSKTMSYDDVEIEDMEWNEELKAYTYPCPCGDLFQITKDELRIGEEIARCPSCSLYITVIYNLDDFLSDSNSNNKTNTPNQQQPIAVA
uniref:Diphthamide biosynthesis protein 3 n=1 Tax=Fagus sylvatica TaxID=28930 RepID=A0A2N9EDR5_FAGSY